MDKATFEKERAAWNNGNIKNYRFEYDFFNDAGPTGTIKITIPESGDPVIENPDEHDVIFKNISEIYDFINRTFDFIERVKNETCDGHKIKSLTLDITYHTQYHYPEEVRFSEGYVEMIDGGGYYTVKVKNFHPLRNGE
jgi:hypothetical protein